MQALLVLPESHTLAYFTAQVSFVVCLVTRNEYILIRSPETGCSTATPTRSRCIIVIDP